MREEKTAGRVEFRRNVVGEEFMDQLLGRLLAVLRDLLESLVGGSEDSVVGGRPIQNLNQVWVFVDEFRELGGVLRASDQLIDSLIWLVVRVVAMRWMFWVLRLVGFLVWVIEHLIDIEIFDSLNGRVEPSLGIERHHRIVAFKLCRSLLAGIGGSIDGVVECILEGVFDFGPSFLDGSFELLEVGLRLFFDGNLFHDPLVGQDEGSGDGRKWQDGSNQLHIDAYWDER